MSFSLPGDGSSYLSRASNFPTTTGTYSALGLFKLTSDLNKSSALLDFRYYGGSSTGHTVGFDTDGTSICLFANWNVTPSASVGNMTVGSLWWVGFRGNGTNAEVIAIPHNTTTINKQSLTQTTFAPNQVFWAGNDGGAENSNIEVAHMREWNAVLSDAEILAEIASLTAVRTTDLISAKNGSGADLTAALLGQTGATFVANGTITKTADLISSSSSTVTVGGTVPILPQVSVDSVVITGTSVAVTCSFASIDPNADLEIYLLDGGTPTVVASVVPTVNGDVFYYTFTNMAAGVYDVQGLVTDTYGSATDTDFTHEVIDTPLNHTPSITSDGGGSTAAVSVIEGRTAVTVVQAYDEDLADTLVFSISGGADQAHFSITSSTGILTFSSAPVFASPTDANADNIYVVTVQVSDGTATASQTISVTVTEEAVVTPGTFQVSAKIHRKALGATGLTGAIWAKNNGELLNLGPLLYTFTGLNFEGSLSNNQTQLIIPVPANVSVIEGQVVRCYLTNGTLNTPIFDAVVETV